MRRPTLKQLQDIREVMGNGYGDGDYVAWMDDKDRQRINRSIYAFERWIESIGNFKFSMYTSTGGK